MELTIETLKTLYPEIDSKVRAEAHAAGLAEGQKDALGKGSKAERERITAILAVALGDDLGAKAKALIESGITAEQYKATGASLITPPTDAEAQAKAEILAGIKKAGAPSIGADGKPIPPAPAKDFLALVDEHVAAHKCGKVAAMQAVMKAHPEAHKAYIEKANEGRA